MNCNETLVSFLILLGVLAVFDYVKNVLAIDLVNTDTLLLSNISDDLITEDGMAAFGDVGCAAMPSSRRSS